MGDLISESKMTAGGVNTLRGALPALYRHQSSVVYNIIYVSYALKKFDMKIYLGGHMEYTHNIKESLFKNNKKGRKKNTYTYSKMSNKNVKN